MEITFDTKVGELLDAYPFLEEELIKINPRFKKLKNPILRRTVAKIATLKQAARVGGMESLELVNKIRAILGEPPLQQQIDVADDQEKTPNWITKEPVAILDANELLDQGKNPLAELNKALKSVRQDDMVLLKADFRPEPLIEEMKKRGHEIFVQQNGATFFVYVKKK